MSEPNPKYGPPEVRALLDEYYEIVVELRGLTKKKVTRRHKEGHYRQLEILKKIGRLRPHNVAVSLVGEYVEDADAGRV